MLERLNNFITPERSASLAKRLMPYGILIFAGLVAFAVAGAGWEYTNRSEFCGTACHTMPPEYLSYLESPHANVKCVECHIGRATIAEQFTRKAQDITHVVRFVGADYEVPIYSKKLRPASQVCERCHNPEKFSPNSLTTIRTYDAAKNNELSEIHLSFKTGGGTQREGRGKGIHWHIENQVEYIAEEAEPQLDQEIPWVRVTYADSGVTEVFTDIDAELPANFVEENADRMKVVDCMTCHNRISHKFVSPEDALDDALSRNIVSPAIPYIKQNAVAVMERQYPDMDEDSSRSSGLRDYYAANWSDYYAENSTEVDTAVQTLEDLYQRMVFPTMDASWTTHPDNLGHKDWPGCFRCHDGKHLNEKQESIRIECNLCHSIPIKSPEDGSTPSIALTEAYEPESHVDTNWIARHRFEFDGTCEGCHSVQNAGGGDDSSFCANSACHATEWKFAGLDATGIVELTNVLAENLPTYPETALTWNDLVAPILAARCVACHGGTAGLYLDSYQGLMDGGNLGPAIIPGNAEASLLVQLQREGHPNRLALRELEWIIEWINAGAAES
ncbi:MAG: NapC/NirT family cytochrome c [Caldilineaceae bacterium]|nr:NapC/NirT family cytochrome c [Caldilineaceae bacterium]